MYINKINGCVRYETLDELIDKPITLFDEYGDSYYIMLKCNEKYHEGTIWKVDKQSEKATYFGDFAAYILSGIEDKAAHINIEKFKSERVKKSS